MRRVLTFAGRLFKSPAFKHAVHTAGVLLIAAAQLIAIWA
jgi:hypothetical protein